MSEDHRSTITRFYRGILIFTRYAFYRGIMWFLVQHRYDSGVHNRPFREISRVCIGARIRQPRARRGGP
jgi:hypothetical protein